MSFSPTNPAVPTALSTPQSRRRNRSRGFSLVEITLAIGVVAFAFVGLFALLPAGLATFRQAMDTSVGSQIVQRIVSDAQETDFEVLLESAVEKNKGASSQYYRLPIRYFDDQGTEVAVTAEAPTEEELTRILYTVRIRGSNPGKANPSTHNSNYFTSLPAVSGSRFNPRDLTILTIQVVTNPSNRPLTPLVDSSTFLISLDRARKVNVPVQNYSVALARNGKRS